MRYSEEKSGIFKSNNRHQEKISVFFYTKFLFNTYNDTVSGTMILFHCHTYNDPVSLFDIIPDV